MAIARSIAPLVPSPLSPFVAPQPKASHQPLVQPPLQPVFVNYLPSSISCSHPQTLLQTLPAGISTIVSGAMSTVNSFISAVTKVAVAPTLVPSALKASNMLPVSLSHLLPSTPVCIPILAQELEHYPNQQFATELVQDLQFGCRIGYQGPRYPKFTPNLKSTLLHPEAVTEALHKKII